MSAAPGVNRGRSSMTAREIEVTPSLDHLTLIEHLADLYMSPAS